MRVTMWLRYETLPHKIFIMSKDRGRSEAIRRALVEVFAEERYRSGHNFDTFHVNLRAEGKVHEYEVRVRQPSVVFEAV